MNVLCESYEQIIDKYPETILDIMNVRHNKLLWNRKAMVYTFILGYLTSFGTTILCLHLGGII